MAAERSEFLEGSSSDFSYLDDVQFSDAVERRLQALVASAELLEIKEVSFSAFFSALQALSDKKLSLKQMLHRTAYAEKELRTHLAVVKHEQELINKWKEHFEASETTEETTEVLERRRLALLKKAKEYKKELESIKLVEPPVTISELSAQQERNKEIEMEIGRKRAKLKAFQGLPPDLGLAQIELKEARKKQMRLVNLRENLLSKMVQDIY
ncbi:hypothetical protein Moror_14821 [Moniliophthora roreri MCA 2997]|nr:hypothetical protein Moror_14821 [Moniliophthora roreri MCA 2997]